MTNKLRIVLAQLNLTVGDIAGNLQKHQRAIAIARDELAADVIVFPELSLTGYPPEDLLLRQTFIEEADKALQTLMQDSNDIYCLVGHPLSDSQHLYNACSMLYNGQLVGQYAKQCLPNYGVFDERRYFIPGHLPCVVLVRDVPIGIVICEDAWMSGPIQQAVAAGAQCILSPNASPFEVEKYDQRITVLANQAIKNRVAIFYTNMVGGQDELIFDGGSMVIDQLGNIAQFAGFFNETLLPVDIDFTQQQVIAAPVILPSPLQKIYEALVLSVRDYINKNHFPSVLLGLSGGIDSALTLAIAVDALGKDRVKAVLMPSRYTAEISISDAQAIADRLGVQYETISIEPTYEAFLKSLAASFRDTKPDITEENIQARCRAIILMALSNKTGALVLTTGNRSEMAVGYCTLYGDMAGGFAPLKDVPKTLVYELARYRNQQSNIIPERTITRPPSAELAPDQKDEDSLPPYSVLDKILEAYLNHGLSAAEIIAQGFDAGTVKRVLALIQKNEYKRRQSAIGPRINQKSFGRDWRYPVTNGFKG